MLPTEATLLADPWSSQTLMSITMSCIFEGGNAQVNGVGWQPPVCRLGTYQDGSGERLSCAFDDDSNYSILCSSNLAASNASFCP